MWPVLVAILCGDARAYVGPQQGPSGETQIEPIAAPLAEPSRGVVHAPREVVHAPLEGPAETFDAPAPTPFFARRPRMPGTGPQEERAHVRPRSGRGLLIAGGVLAGTGFAMSVFVLAAWFRPCSDFCEPYGAIFTSVAAPAPWLVGIGMLGGGMQHHSHMLAMPDVAGGRAVKPPRRGMFGAGLAMAIIGAGTIVGTWWAPGINAFAQIGGGPLAVAGAMMAGAARGRRLALRTPVTITPVVTPTTRVLSLAMRW